MGEWLHLTDRVSRLEGRVRALEGTMIKAPAPVGFKVGDLVRYLMVGYGPPSGSIGVVRTTNEKIIGVEWAVPFAGAHDLDGLLFRPRGWYVPARDIELA